MTVFSFYFSLATVEQVHHFPSPLAKKKKKKKTFLEGFFSLSIVGGSRQKNFGGSFIGYVGGNEKAQNLLSCPVVFFKSHGPQKDCFVYTFKILPMLICFYVQDFFVVKWENLRGME